MEQALSVLQQFEEVLGGSVLEELRTAEAGDVIELTRAFVRLRTVKDALDTSVKEFNSIYEEFKTEKMPQAFEAAGIPNLTLDEGVRVTISHRLFASIKPSKKLEAYEWLKENGLGDLITATVNSSTLSAAAKTMGEDNVELPDELFSTAIVPNTSITKTRA